MTLGSILPIAGFGRTCLVPIVLAVLAGNAARAEKPGPAAWFPDQPRTPLYAWAARTCQGCEALKPRPGWQAMAALAGLRDVRFMVSVDAQDGAAYSIAPNVIVLAPAALQLEQCQLAFVVGHEMAHIARRHFDEDAQVVSILSGKPAGWTSKGDKAMSLLDDNFILALRMAQHWQQQEREADWLGTLLSAEVYGCAFEDGALPYLQAAEGYGGGIGAAHEASATRVEFLRAFSESARRLAFQAYYVDY